MRVQRAANGWLHPFRNPKSDLGHWLTAVPMYHISDSFLRDLIASRSGLGPHAFVLHHASFFFQHKMPKGAGKHTQGFRVLTLTASNQNLDLRLTNPGFGQVFNFHTEILSRFLFPVGEIRQNFVWSLAGCL